MKPITKLKFFKVKKMTKMDLFFLNPRSIFAIYARNLESVLECSNIEARSLLALSLSDFAMGAEVDSRFGDAEFLSEIQKKHDFTDATIDIAKSTAKLARMHQLVLLHKDRLPIKRTALRLKTEYPIFQKICIDSDIRLATAMLIVSFFNFEGSLDKLFNTLPPTPKV